jgi:hypothetical protein
VSVIAIRRSASTRRRLTLQHGFSAFLAMIKLQYLHKYLPPPPSLFSPAPPGSTGWSAFLLGTILKASKTRPIRTQAILPEPNRKMVSDTHRGKACRHRKRLSNVIAATGFVLFWVRWC